MQQSLVELEERKISEDRSANFRGTARVRLEFLSFDSEELRSEDVKNRERLEGIFKTEGCWRTNPRNYVPAVVDQQSLDDAIQRSGTSLEDLLENPGPLPPELKFPPNYRLECLHGRHRIEAARKTLTPKSNWWIVNFYLEDASPGLRTELIEEYSNSLNFSDGEIYCKIRQYKSSSSPFIEKKWWARLSESKRNDLKQFLKHDSFPRALDALFVIPVLLSIGLRISMLREIIAMKYDEEVINYFSHILDVWSSILNKNQEWMRHINRVDVEALQLRVPGLCIEDSKTIRDLLNRGIIFRNITSQPERRAIWENLCKVKVLIPSIYTFFEDIKYLKPCAKIMKSLLGKSFKGSIRTNMEHNFSGVNQREGQIQIQESETSLTPYSGSLADQMDLGIFQLWLFSGRNFYEMIKDCPLKEDRHPTPVPKKANASTWWAFATLAYALGFESDQIHRLRLQAPDKEIARTALLEARNPDRFRYEDGVFESFQNQITNMFASAAPIAQPFVEPRLFMEGPGETLKRRCGRTFEFAYDYDRQFLFLNIISSANSAGGNGISSLFVRMSVYFAFFKGPMSFSLGTPIGPRIPLAAQIFANNNISVTSSHQVGEASQQEARLNEEINKLRKDLANAGQDQEKARNLIANLRTENSSTEMKVELLKKEKTSLEQKVQLLETNMLNVAGKFQEQANKFKDDLTTHRQSMSQAMEVVERLKRERAAMEERIRESEEGRTSGSGELEEARHEHQKLFNAYGELQERHSRMEHVLDSKSTELSKFKELYSKAILETDASRSDLTRLNQVISANDQNLAIEIEHLKGQLSESIKDAQLARKENHQNLIDQEKLKHAEGNIIILETQNALAIKEIEQMKIDKGQNLAELQRLRELENGYKDAKKTASKGDSRLAAEIETLKAKVAESIKDAELAKRETYQMLVDQERLRDAETELNILKTQYSLAFEEAEQVKGERDQNLAELQALKLQLSKSIEDAELVRKENHQRLVDEERLRDAEMELNILKTQHSLAIEEAERVKGERDQNLAELQTLKLQLSKSTEDTELVRKENHQRLVDEERLRDTEMELNILKTQHSLAIEEAERVKGERDQNLAKLQRLQELEKGYKKDTELAKKAKRQRLMDQEKLKHAEENIIILETQKDLAIKEAEQIKSERDQNLAELKRLRQLEKAYNTRQAKPTDDAEVAERLSSMRSQVSRAMKDAEDARMKSNQVLEDFEILKGAENNHRLEIAALKIQLDNANRDAEKDKGELLEGRKQIEESEQPIAGLQKENIKSYPFC